MRPSDPAPGLKTRPTYGFSRDEVEVVVRPPETEDRQCAVVPCLDEYPTRADGLDEPRVITEAGGHSRLERLGEVQHHAAAAPRADEQGWETGRGAGKPEAATPFHCGCAGPRYTSISYLNEPPTLIG